MRGVRRIRPNTIRGRLVAVLAVSLATVLALLGVLVTGELHAYRDAGRTGSDVDLALGVQSTTHELQRERGLTNGLLAGRTDYRAALDEQRGRTDRALDHFADATDGLDTEALDAARNRWSRLAGIRADVDAGQAQREPTFAYFTDGIAELVQAGAAPERTRDGELLRGLAALRALGDAKEAAAQARGFLNGVLSAGRFQGAEYLAFTEIRAAHLVALQEFRRNATAGQQARADAVPRSAAAIQAQGIERVALAAADGRSLAPLAPTAWWAAMTTVIDGLWEVQRSMGEEVRDRAAELRSDAAADLWIYLIVAALFVIGEAVLTLVAVRSITRPLTALAVAAEDVAATRLPEVVTRLRAGDHAPARLRPVAVPRRAGREVHAVAVAFGRVQETAVQLAAEQAVLRRNTTDSLVNLARRNQNLVRRQLGFISRLEHEEADPTALGNLFELDHLATRMRRNAESLLVLVGEAGPRTGSAPLHITDVVRAALSEVEDYRRVLLRRMDDTAVSGAVVPELAHLLAELIENALAFSPPEVEVEIYGRRVGHGYLVAVIDHGVGMSAEAMETANTRLAGRVDFLDAPSRALGHHVVGRLARRLGADVRVGESPATGVTARVLLPAEILADPGAVRGLPPVPGAPPLVSDPGWGAGPPGVVAGGQTAGDPAGSESLASVVPAALVPAAGDVAAPAVRTRNGLTKRVPRHRATASPPPRPPVAPDPLPDIHTERTPDDVRSMLSAFRGGHLRGEVAEFGGFAAGTGLADPVPQYSGARATAPHPTPYLPSEEDPA